MIQRIRNARTGREFVCDIPEGWNAVVWSDSKVVMVYYDGCPPIALERGKDFIWRQRETPL